MFGLERGWIRARFRKRYIWQLKDRLEREGNRSWETNYEILATIYMGGNGCHNVGGPDRES